jgi:hypothetical protein
MKKIILLCCFFCFFGFNSMLKSSPLDLIESLKEEMSPSNKQFLSALIHSEVKKNENQIAHLREQLNVNRGGKMVAELQRKREINQKIERLESQNESLSKNL